MSISVTNSSSSKVAVGSLILDQAETKVISDDFHSKYWEVLLALETAGVISMAASGIEAQTYQRYVYSFTGATVREADGSIEVVHGRDSFPIVQVVDDIGDSVQILPDSNDAAGYTIGPYVDHIVDVVHVDSDTVRVYTNSIAGSIIMLF